MRAVCVDMCSSISRKKLHPGLVETRRSAIKRDECAYLRVGFVFNWLLYINVIEKVKDYITTEG